MAPQDHDFAARIAELESELARDSSPKIFAPLAEAYRLSGQLDKALETARLGIKAHPDHMGIRVVLARATVDSEGRETGLPAYEDVLKLDPDNLEARAYIDSVPEPPEAPAEGAGTRMLPAEAPPTTPEDIEQPARRPGAGSLSEELAHLADLFMPSDTNSGGPSLGPSSIATLTLAEIYSRQGLHNKAAEVCERILERDPDNERARSALEEYRRNPASV